MGVIGTQAGPIDTSLSPWAQFGFPGLVTGALFLTLLFFIRQHFQERKEWREDMSKLADKHDATSRDNVAKFVALHERTLDAIRDRK